MLHARSSSNLHCGFYAPRWQNDGMDIRDRIRKVLDERPDLSPRNVSLAAGLSDSMIHKYLTGATRSMTVENLESVAKALGVNSRWLIFGDAPQMPDEKLVHIWDHIPQRRRDQALRVLEAFVEGDKESGAG